MDNAQSIVGFSKDREENDFYPTPKETTLALMNREKFEGNIWECASGDGSMSKVLEKFNTTISTEFRSDEEVYGEKGIDFMTTHKKVDNIITNPPYKYAEEFVKHALICADKKVCMLLKLVFLESISRYDLFKSSPLKTIYVFCRRQKIYKKGIIGKNAGLIAYAWFVWEKGYTGKPTIEWIKNVETQESLDVNQKEVAIPPKDKSLGILANDL